MTETEKITAKIAFDGNGKHSEAMFLKAEYDAWITSRKRMEMAEGSRYYQGESDISYRIREMIGENGKKSYIDNIPNNRCKINFTRLLADQKTGYLLSKRPSVKSSNREFLKETHKYLDNAFYNLLFSAGTEAIVKGIAWIMAYYTEKGKLSFKLIPSEEIIPFWQDETHTQLEAVLRVYETDSYENGQKTVLTRAEYYTPEGIFRYILNGNEFIPDVEYGYKSGYFKLNGETDMAWEKLPFIAVKYNKSEKPLTSLIKSLNDAYEKLISDMMNALEEDPRNTILVLRNYDGQDLSEFRKNLALFGAVKVCDDGGVETLSVAVNPSAYEAAERILRAGIFKNGHGIDMRDQSVGNAPSGIALKFLYSDLELDCNIFENELSQALDNIIWFIKTDLALKQKGNYPDAEAEFVFNRDMLINEAEIIASCKESLGLISKRTITANHPWVTDLETEIKEIEKECEADGMDL